MTRISADIGVNASLYPLAFRLLGSQIGHELQKMTAGAMKTILPANVMLYESR